MPQFTLPPDTRAVGTGNPPADMNALIDALISFGIPFNLMSAGWGTVDNTGAADSTAAFANCMSAAIAANAEMTIPPGAYNLSAAGNSLPSLHITGPFKMRGLGAGLNNGGSLIPAVRLTSNTPGNMFDFPFQGYGWGGLETSGISVLFTGTGNVYSGMNMGDAVWRDMDITLTASGSQAMVTTGSISFLNVLHERCNFTTTNPVRTKPMISISSSIAAAISNCTFFKCKFSNKGCDNTQFMVHFDCSAASGIAYHYMDNFRECCFEQPFGGAVHCQAGQNITIDACMVWDIFSGPTTSVAAASNGGTISGIASWSSPSAGVLAVASTQFFNPAPGQLQVAASGSTTALVNYTGISGNTFTGCTYVSGSPAGTVATGGSVVLPVPVGNSTFYFGAFPGGANTQGVRITGCGRAQSGPNGSTTWDVECESTTSQVYIQGWVNKASSPSTATNAFFNFHGCNDVVLIGNQSPQGASVNGNSTTVITNPAANTLWLHNGALQAPTGQNVTFASPLAVSGRVDITLAGSGFRAAEGSNAKQGTALLSAGTVTVANTSVTANSRIVLTAQTLGTVTTPSALCVSARTAGTSFTILASQNTDTSIVAYQIYEPV